MGQYYGETLKFVYIKYQPIWLYLFMCNEVSHHTLEYPL